MTIYCLMCVMCCYDFSPAIFIRWFLAKRSNVAVLYFNIVVHFSFDICPILVLFSFSCFRLVLLSSNISTYIYVYIRIYIYVYIGVLLYCILAKKSLYLTLQGEELGHCRVPLF